MASKLAISGMENLPPPSDRSSASSDLLDVEDEEGWDDVEGDEEQIQVLCLFEDAHLPDVHSLLGHCEKVHDWKIGKICKDLELDFYGAIRLVNYIRSEVRAGKSVDRVPSKEEFEDDKYLQPVLEDDALLCGLDEILNVEDHTPGDGAIGSTRQNPTDFLAEAAKLKEELQRLQSQFSSYKEAVKGVLDDRLESQAASLDTPSHRTDRQLDVSAKDTLGRHKEDDFSYFDSYSYNDIHELMLKDVVRTEAYRDFIYDYKDVFRDKVVLDVGCGTGILSMFCAKAGAKKVIAVDNSEIISKARENVFNNGLGDKITCLKGKIEEVTLPVKQVDIIISEWMGYCLLYEAMLDSVIWARDHYLAPDGLMVPSHITLFLAPVSDADYIASHVSFWHSVYGFSMTSMLESIYQNVLNRHFSPPDVVSIPASFLNIPLHTVTQKDLTFNKDFVVYLKEDIDALDGWAVWFDVFFMPSPTDVVPEDFSATQWKRQGKRGVAFTTGPEGPETHWRQGLLLVDYEGKAPPRLDEGQKIAGQIAYRKREHNSRELDIEVTWHIDKQEGEKKQLWLMR